YAKLDNQLHESLLDCFNNRFILNIMRKVYIHNRRLRQLSPEHSSIAEHVAIIDAILSKDASAIEKATIEHIENSKKLSLSAREHGFFNKRDNLKCQI
ncbi:MAG: FCD domain-containing protein, partial [Succinatimonas sp.]|nr:FCD domain-containing protein [Succinatimonas sp.]